VLGLAAGGWKQRSIGGIVEVWHAPRTPPGMFGERLECRRRECGSHITARHTPAVGFPPFCARVPLDFFLLAEFVRQCRQPSLGRAVALVVLAVAFFYLHVDASVVAAPVTRPARCPYGSPSPPSEDHARPGAMDPVGRVRVAMDARRQPWNSSRGGASVTPTAPEAPCSVDSSLEIGRGLSPHTPHPPIQDW
jgi:hypothetical protein